jgi:5'-methylthioadenosine nucleosidase
MEAEAKLVVERLGLRAVEGRLPPHAPGAVYSGEAHGLTVDLVTYGKCRATGVDNVGTAGAVLVTAAAAQALEPDLFISAGTAGGFSRRGGAVGDVYLCAEFANHDRRIAIPGFDRYGVGRVATGGAAGGEAIGEAARSLGLKQGVVTTGNSLDCLEKDMEMIEANGADVKDMEAAAVAWTASWFGVPVLGIKAVTDIVDGDRPSHDEFLENLGAACKALEVAVPRVLEHLAGSESLRLALLEPQAADTGSA